MRPYVVGFFGARDGFELPVALQEGGLLSGFLTDFYGRPAGLGRWLGGKKQFAERCHECLSKSMVVSSFALGVLQRGAHRLIRDPERAFEIADRALASRLHNMARKRNASILTYEPHAIRLSPEDRARGMRLVIFYCHPHVGAEDNVVSRDRESFGELYAGQVFTDSPWRLRTADAWREADLVLCASSYTKKTLVQAGMNSDRCRVIPYGSTQRMTSFGGEEIRSSEKLHVLFVGRRPLRKGLHHLLLAWRAANLGNGAELTIVAPRKPEDVFELVKDLPNVRWKESLSSQELCAEYERSHLLAVPSLSEGFGHVYLEAMEHGCAVVGTRNSALPDIGDERQGVFTVGVGNVDELARLISDAASDPCRFRKVSEAARQQARSFTWSRFREEVRRAVTGA